MYPQKTKEYRLIFHLAANSEEQAREFHERILNVLDSHQIEIRKSLDSDEGALCSGHLNDSEE